jgi:hypothetical protein
MLKSLVDITDEEITTVNELSALFFTPSEIALMMEFHKEEVQEAMLEDSSKFYTAFQTGRLNSEMELRKSIIKLARSGSSPAQTMSLEMLNKSKAKMLDS